MGFWAYPVSAGRWGPEVGARARAACRGPAWNEARLLLLLLLLLRAAEVRFTCLAGADGKPNKGQAGQSVIAAGFLLHHATLFSKKGPILSSFFFSLR